MLEVILEAVYPGQNFAPARDIVDYTSSKNSGCGGSKKLKDKLINTTTPASTATTTSNVHLVLRALKNAIVGNDEAKAVALRLGVVEDILRVLDEAESNKRSTAATAAVMGTRPAHDQNYCEDVTLHSMGLFAVLASPIAAGGALSASSGARIIEHVARALNARSGTAGDRPSQNIASTALRALNAMFASIAPPTEPSLALTSLGGRVVAVIGEVAQHVLESVVCGGASTPALHTLGVEVLATMTRDREIARSLGPSVVSTGTAFLLPVLPIR